MKLNAYLLNRQSEKTPLDLSPRTQEAFEAFTRLVRMDVRVTGHTNGHPDVVYVAGEGWAVEYEDEREW